MRGAMDTPTAGRDVVDANGHNLAPGQVLAKDQSANTSMIIAWKYAP
jgi:hypothetical protein